MLSEFLVTSNKGECFRIRDVKEFIRLLKDCLRTGNNPISSDYLREKIDKLAGEKLCTSM